MILTKEKKHWINMKTPCPNVLLQMKYGHPWSQTYKFEKMNK